MQAQLLIAFGVAFIRQFMISSNELSSAHRQMQQTTHNGGETARLLTQDSGPGTISKPLLNNHADGSCQDQAFFVHRLRDGFLINFSGTFFVDKGSGRF
jgi:hypothetical protein